jgi:hypothetical protein
VITPEILMENPSLFVWGDRLVAWDETGTVLAWSLATGDLTDAHTCCPNDHFPVVGSLHAPGSRLLGLLPVASNRVVSWSGGCPADC